MPPSAVIFNTSRQRYDSVPNYLIRQRQGNKNPPTYKLFDYRTVIASVDYDDYFTSGGPLHKNKNMELLCNAGVCWEPFNGDPNTVLDAIALDNDRQVIVQYKSGWEPPSSSSPSSPPNSPFGLIDFAMATRETIQGVRSYLSGRNCLRHQRHHQHQRLIAGEIPADAVIGGSLLDGRPLYVCIASHEGDMLPGRYTAGDSCAYFSHGCEMVSKEEFELVRCAHPKWIASQNGDAVPGGAIIGGHTFDDECLYFGRARFSSPNWIPGKVHRSHRCMYAAYGDTEMNAKEYEVLVDEIAHTKWLQEIRDAA